jgi:hypothetical protein
MQQKYQSLSIDEPIMKSLQLPVVTYVCKRASLSDRSWRYIDATIASDRNDAQLSRRELMPAKTCHSSCSKKVNPHKNRVFPLRLRIESSYSCKDCPGIVGIGAKHFFAFGSNRSVEASTPMKRKHPLPLQMWRQLNSTRQCIGPALKNGSAHIPKPVRRRPHIIVDKSKISPFASLTPTFLA